MAKEDNRRSASDPHQITPRHVTSNSHISVHHENVSVEICGVMNWLGYGPDLRQARRDAYKKIARSMTGNAGENATFIITGSKADGTTCHLENDIDVMKVIERVACVENGSMSNIIQDDMTVFTIKELMQPGYCMLFQKRLSPGFPSEYRDALCGDGSGNIFLSSDLFFDKFCDRELGDETFGDDDFKCKRAGPSQPAIVCGELNVDLVPALPCYCPSILQRWAERPRYWPSPDIVQKVLVMRAFVTPVGCKVSEYKYLEWRIGFNTAENELIANLNDTQVKIFVLLKMITKDVIKPRNKEITSFMLKNIVLWLAENNPVTLFHERNLIHWLLEGLVELRKAIASRHLPYYMITERNLMASCGLEDKQQRLWDSLLTDMLVEGPRLILKLPRIRKSIISHPEPLRCYSRLRTELDLLMIKCLMCSMCEEGSDNYGLMQELKTVVRDRIDEICLEFARTLHMDVREIDDYDIIMIAGRILR